MSRSTRTFFWSWTACFWAVPALCGFLFWRGAWSSLLASKVALYAISIWLNACVLVLIRRRGETRTRAGVYRDFLIVWMISFSMTNLLWEWPWFLSSRFLFHGLHTIDDWNRYSEYVREHMWVWPLVSFGAVDLRAINGNGTFMAVEMLSIPSVLTFTAFYFLDRRRHPLRYALPLLNAPMVIGGTLIFSFSEVFGGYANMAGGVADTLLALVWTQYQYVVFPAMMAWFSLLLLLDDRSHNPALRAPY